MPSGGASEASLSMISRLGMSSFTSIGLFALADIGRVFYELDPPDADTWHTAFGGGLWLSLLGDLNTMSVAIARSDEKIGVYVRTGFHF